MKVYVPAPDGRFGMIFMLKFQPDGRPVLMFLAFGVRHHPRGLQRPTVYHSPISAYTDNYQGVVPEYGPRLRPLAARA